MGNHIVLIGSGPGGYTAAVRAAQLGAQVTLIEKDALGGTCVNRGCIPTKALLQSADVFTQAQNAATLGVIAKQVSLDFSVVAKRKKMLVQQMVDGIAYLMKKNKIEVIKGTGRFLEVASQTLKVDVADLGKLSAKSKNRAEISSMCTVFAQAEIVSMIMQKTPIEDIIAGLHYAIASRVFGLVSSIGPKLEYAMVGGVAKNLGVVRAMEEKLGHKIHVPEEPQLIVATGAALM
jgi:hypothetical protein